MAIEIIRVVFRYIHILGMAAVVGGLISQMGKDARRVGTIEFHGLATQLVTGLILMVITISDVDHIKVTVKFALLVVLFVLFLLQRRVGELSKKAYLLDLLLAFTITGVAVFWRVYGT